MQPLLIYCYDAYCGWCYGFSPVIKKISEDFREQLHIEVLSGGMILPDEPVPVSAMAPYIRKAYKNVEEVAGVQFGEDYLWHIFHEDQSDWFPSSEKPAIAMCVFKDYFPDRQVDFAADLQYSLHYEGRDLTDNEAYRHLLEKYGVPAKEFYEKVQDTRYEESAYHEFELVRQLKVSGFPSLFVQAGESRFYMVARGYTNYETVKKNIDEALYSITKEPSPF